jgi:hypothetical protein
MKPVRLSALSQLVLLIGAAMPTATLAQSQSQYASSAHQPAIIEFDVKGAGVGPGTTNCFGACPGTVAVNGNSSGAVTGYYVDDSNLYHGFVRYCDGKIVTFDAPGAGTLTGSAQGTVAYSINSEGAIAGQFQDASSKYHGFLRSPDGVITTFDVPGVQFGANQGPGGSANINDDGEIAGYFIDGNNVNHGFVRHRDGKIKTFDVLVASTLANFAPQGTVVALESGLNSEGAITGWYFDSAQAVHGYLRSPDGRITLFDNMEAGTAFFQGTYGGSINSEGAITGGAIDANYVSHGFIRYPGGEMRTFDAPCPGAPTGCPLGTFGVGINRDGVVTAYTTDVNSVSHGSIRNSEGHFTSFDAEGAGTGVGQGTTPQGINSSGIVMGYYTDSNNVNHGFLRLPDDDCHDKR